MTTKEIISLVMKKHPTVVANCRAGKTYGIGFLVGQAYVEGSREDPRELFKLFERELSR